jgi:hypothetical protein
MIKYNEWGQHLRLGNWLFLYSGLSSISKQSNNGVVFPNHFMWNYFENPPFITDNKEYDELFHFKPEPYSEKLKKEYIEYFRENQTKIINVNLGSHLQSEKWFIEDIDYIKSLLAIKQSNIDIVRNKYLHFFNKPTIGIGIRRGDFVNHGVFYQIPENWYEKALKEEFINWQEFLTRLS